MDSAKIIIAIFTLFFSGATLSFTICKYMFGKQFDGILDKINAEKANTDKQIERVDKARENCRLHCEQCRILCNKERKEDITRLYDKIEAKL